MREFGQWNVFRIVSTFVFCSFSDIFTVFFFFCLSTALIIIVQDFDFVAVLSKDHACYTVYFVSLRTYCDATNGLNCFRSEPVFPSLMGHAKTLSDISTFVARKVYFLLYFTFFVYEPVKRTVSLTAIRFKYFTKNIIHVVNALVYSTDNRRWTWRFNYFPWWDIAFDYYYRTWKRYFRIRFSITSAVIRGTAEGHVDWFLVNNLIFLDFFLNNFIFISSINSHFIL